MSSFKWITVTVDLMKFGQNGDEKLRIVASSRIRKTYESFLAGSESRARGSEGSVPAPNRYDPGMSSLSRELRDLIESGPMAHLSTINPDGSPQVTVIWIGLDGDAVVSAHMALHVKLRNIERDPRVVLSFDAPRAPGVAMNPYAVVRARAAVQPSEEAWDLLNRLAKVYIAPDAGYPPPKRPGYIVRYSVERVGGIGPWAP